MSTLPDVRTWIRENWRRMLPFAVLFGVMLLFHAMLWEHPDLDSVRYFARALKKRDLFEFLSMRYESWSSRLVIEGALAVLSRHLTLWKLLDSLLFVLLAASLSCITGGLRDERANWWAASLVLLYPIGEMQSAGWIATTMNYSWPLTFGLFSCTVIPAVIQKKRIHPVHGILAVLAAVYACNMELMAGVLLFVYLFFFLKKLLQKERPSVMLSLLLLADVLNLVLIARCPGNRVRMAEEALTGTSGFMEMNAPEKLILGFENTMSTAFNENLILLVFSILVFFFVAHRYQQTAPRLIAVLPPALLLFRSVVSGFFPSMSLLLIELPVLSRGTLSIPSAWSMLFFWVLFTGCLTVAILLLAEDAWERIFFGLIFWVGILSRAVLGFSPTLENSAHRTFLFFDFVMLFLMLVFSRRQQALAKKTLQRLDLGFGTAVMLNVLHSFVFASRLTL